LYALLSRFKLEPLVPGAQGFHFPAKAVVIRHFPRHAQITGNKPKEGNTSEERKREHDVNKSVRDVDASEPAMKRVSKDDDEIRLVQKTRSPVLVLTAPEKQRFSRPECPSDRKIARVVPTAAKGRRNPQDCCDSRLFKENPDYRDLRYVSIGNRSVAGMSRRDGDNGSVADKGSMN
jgi:hypothetical protein